LALNDEQRAITSPERHRRQSASRIGQLTQRRNELRTLLIAMLKAIAANPARKRAIAL
jgi:hypothetical protein